MIMADIIDFIRAQLDTDEQGIRQAIRTEEWGVGERDLRTVQAHRAILDAYELARSHPTSLVSSFVRGQDNGFWQGLEEAVKELVSIYSDRDGYKEEWSV